MKSIFLKIASFVTHFTGFEFMYQSGIYGIYTFCFLLSGFMVMSYLGFIYGIKKSEKKDKYIRKEYNIFQRVLLWHWYQNIYKKVDRFWFNLIYRWYLLHLALFLSVIVFSLLSRYWKVCNTIDGILFVVHCVFICITIITHFLNTKIQMVGENFAV